MLRTQWRSKLDPTFFPQSLKSGRERLISIVHLSKNERELYTDKYGNVSCPAGGFTSNITSKIMEFPEEKVLV